MRTKIIKIIQKGLVSGQDLLALINRFNPFYRPRQWSRIKYLTFNTFKGYQMFDFHLWGIQDRSFLDGGIQNKYKLAMIGVTIFYYRIELFFNFNHKGPCWEESRFY